MRISELIKKLARIPVGFSGGIFAGSRYGMTKSVSSDGRRVTFFSEELGGRDIVSFNLYKTAEQGWVLKPCEMSSDKVYEFIDEVALEVPDAVPTN